ncbi:MAG: xanthine dehydrogenase family protein subunit M [Myxococcota bacterium]
MYPPRFDYVAPTTLDEALEALAEHGDEGKIIAGGQSLIPMLKLRFASPETLIDINRLTGLDSVSEDGDVLRFGALCRHNQLGDDALMKSKYHVVADAGRLIADPLVRNMGTLGGSLCHADPQADWGSVMIALKARIVCSKKGGEREVGAAEFMEGIFTTNLADDEIVTEIRCAVPAGAFGSSYLKMERKVGDFATCGTAIAVTLDGGKITSAGIGLTAMGPKNLWAEDTEKLLVGQAPSDELFADAAEAAVKIAEVREDSRGTPEYKKNVLRTFMKRGLAKAAMRAQA